MSGGIRWHDRETEFQRLRRYWLEDNIVDGRSKLPSDDEIMEALVQVSVKDRGGALESAFGDERDEWKRETAASATAEYMWIKNNRPFYHVWPQIVAGLLKVPLTMDCQHLIKLVEALPPQLNVRFQVGHEPNIDGCKIHEFLVARVPAYDDQKDDGAVTMGLGVWVHTSDSEARDSQWRLRFALVPGRTVESVLESTPCDGFSDDEPGSEVLDTCVRITCGIAMLASDPDMVEAIVTKSDRDKYERTGDEKYVAKAKRRGLYGFDVGKRIVIQPGFRQAHFGHRWTGPGKTVLKLVPIKGCIVRRRTATSVPTGYGGES